MRVNCWLQRCILALVMAASSGLSSTKAIAAEKVVLKYRIFQQSVSVEELSTLAQTGQVSPSLRRNFALAQQDPQEVRQYLTQPVKVDPLLLDRVLNSAVGNVVIDEVSKVIHTPSRQADRQALRAAFALSASRDCPERGAKCDPEVTLIETIQNYPTAVVEVDGDRLEDAYLQLRRLQDLFEILPIQLLK